MKILFSVGAGILAEQRVKRWQMVSDLYGRLGQALRSLGHETFYYVHPEAMIDALPAHLVWQCADHEHFAHVLEKYRPGFVFCWNGGSAGDVATATLSHAFGAKMVFSELGWFPQKDSLYFDLTGCNARCSTAGQKFKAPADGAMATFLKRRKAYMDQTPIAHLADHSAFAIAAPDLAKPVLITLQDERDLNIIKDSPFRLMNDFVGFVARRWPETKFIARPHPKYPNPFLDAYPNVTIDNPKNPMAETLSKCGLVIGINSTTLLESALIGYPVMSFGDGLGTGTGVFFDARPETAPVSLERVAVSTDDAAGLLFHLLCAKQFRQEDLGDPIAVMKSNFFKEMVRNQAWNGINR